MPTLMNPLAVFFLLAASVLPRSSAAVYRVDDADSIVKYSSGWKAGNTCEDCLAQPDARDRMFRRTWQDATRNDGDAVNFTIRFTGDSFSVVGVLVNIVETAFTFTTNVNLTLTLDGELVDTYEHEPADSGSYAYNTTVFSQTGLQNTAHTVQVDLLPSSAFLFDYFAYTTPEGDNTPPTGTTNDPSTTPDPNDPSQTNDDNTTSGGSLGPKIGGIVAGVVGLILILFAVFYFMRRRRQKQPRNLDVDLAHDDAPATVVTPFMQQAHAVSQPSFPSYAPSGAESYGQSVGAGFGAVAVAPMSSKAAREQQQYAQHYPPTDVESVYPPTAGVQQWSSSLYPHGVAGSSIPPSQSTGPSHGTGSATGETSVYGGMEDPITRPLTAPPPYNPSQAPAPPVPPLPEKR